MSQQSSLTQSAHSVRQVLTAYNLLLVEGQRVICGSATFADLINHMAKLTKI
jgi:hypothetical protein